MNAIPRELVESAWVAIQESGYPSISYVQRKLMLSYSKASSVMEELERLGLVSAPNPVDGRRVIVADQVHKVGAEQELLEALIGLEAAYCRAGDTNLTSEEVAEDCLRLITAQTLIAKARGAA